MKNSKEDRRWLIGLSICLSLVICVIFFAGYAIGEARGIRQYDEYLRVVQASLHGDDIPYKDFMKKWYGLDE